MKLLDLLKQELKEWPEGATCIVQDYDGEVKAGIDGTPKFSTQWSMWLGCSWFNGLFESDELCEGYKNEVVTKREWDMFNLTTTEEVETQGAATQIKHKHADMIALCAEFAQTMETPMQMFQYKGVCDKEWHDFEKSDRVTFYNYIEYRLKPKTKLINGFEIPDLPFTHEDGCSFYCVNINKINFYEIVYKDSYTERMIDRGLIYPYTEEGKEAAIMHSKALLGLGV